MFKISLLFLCSTAFCLFPPIASAQFVDTIGPVKYGITDNSIFLNQPASLIIRCDQGIDSAEFNIDTLVFEPIITLYNNYREVESIEPGEKLIAYAISLRPLKTGRYWLDDIILWSNSDAYTLTFPDSILVMDCHLSSSNTDNVFKTRSNPKLSEHKDRVKGRRAKVSVWFSDDTCGADDTVYLFVLSNRLSTEHDDNLQVSNTRGLQRGTVLETVTRKGKHSEYYFYWMMVTPISNSPMILEDIAILVGRRKMEFNGIKCFVK